MKSKFDMLYESIVNGLDTEASNAEAANSGIDRVMKLGWPKEKAEVICGKIAMDNDIDSMSDEDLKKAVDIAADELVEDQYRHMAGDK